MKTYNQILRFTLQWEGGWSNDPDDRGGATACGITENTFKTYGLDNDGDGDCDVNDLKLISPEQVERIYMDGYWLKLFKCTKKYAVSPSMLVWPVNAVAFDTAVNSGHRRAMKCLQSALGLNADGIIGDDTAAEISRIIDPSSVALSMCEAREKFLRNLACDPSQQKFLRGWLRRVNALRAFILSH